MAIDTNQGYTMGYGRYASAMGGTGYESEEERRRREAEQLAADDAARLAKLQLAAPPMAQQPAVPVAPVAPEPIKQTITYDPASGEQRMKIEGNARDLSAANPLTPTLTMPGAVSPEQIDQQQQMEMAAQQRDREAQVQAQMAQQQQQQAAVEQQREAQAQAQAQLPQPGPGVQVAGPAQMPPPAQYFGPGQGEEAQTVGQAPPAQQPAQQPVQKTPMDVFTEAAGDTSKLLQIYNDKNQSPELRRMAGREAGRMLDAETKRAEAEDQVKTMSQTDIARLLRSKSEEGSWGKRILFGLLNMESAMKAEDAKLGIGAKWQATNLNGNPVLVKVRADGIPMEGIDATTGKTLGNKELVGAVANISVMKGTQAAGATRVRDSKGTEWSVVPTTTGSIFYDNKGQRGVPDGRTVPITGSTDLELEQSKADIQTIAAFSKMTAQQRLDSYANTNKMRADRGFPTKTLEEMGLNSDGSLIGESVRRPGAPVTQQQAPVTQQQAPVTQQQAPVTQQQAPAGQRTPPVTAQAAPGGGVRLSAGGGSAVAPGAGGKIPTAEQMQRASKESDAARNVREAAATAEAKVPAEERGKVAAKEIAKQGFADSTYPLLQAVREEISKSTGSTIGASVDDLGRIIGASTKGAEAIAKLNILAGPIKMNIPRFEGAQSDRDVQEYARQAGDFANPKLTVRERLAALDAMETLLRKYDKAGNNDWTYGRKAPSDGTTSSGNKYKRVQ
jgi:hypothetical protein